MIKRKKSERSLAQGREAMRRYLSKPENRARNRITNRNAARRRRGTPEGKEKAREWAQRPEVVARRSEANRKRKARGQSLKWEIVRALGGKCFCCGSSDLEFLSVDHVNGDGAAHRRTSRHMVYSEIRSEGYPADKYRLLCFNCNMSIGLWGYCPHTHTRTTEYPVGKPKPLGVAYGKGKVSDVG